MTTLSLTPRTRFAFPAEVTAPAPAESRGLRRDQVRLLVARQFGLVDTTFTALADHLRPGDLLVVNTSATVAAEIDATLVGRGAVVVHVGGPAPGGSVIELRTAPAAAEPVLDAAVGDRLVLPGGVVFTLSGPMSGNSAGPDGVGNRLWRASVDGDVAAALAEDGRPIAYGYLDDRYPLAAYQTVFGTRPGSAEMASAARPFTADLVTRLVSHGVLFAPVTLHTGLSSQDAGEPPQDEWFEVTSATARLVEHVRASGGRVIAVGTTATRALESAVGADGRVVPSRGWTDRVVSACDPPRVVRGLITGWHNPEASHLLLVEAVAGPELTQRAYDAAAGHGYLWHEFGDSGLLLPD